MRKYLASSAVCILIGISAFAPTASARDRHHGDREQFMHNYCGRHSDSDCRDWGQNRRHWDDARYHGWYQRHRHEQAFRADDSASVIFGFTAGAVAGAMNGMSDDSHAEACDARYRSYDEGSDTFMGYDGLRHRCML
jgi:hypothetical protein